MSIQKFLKKYSHAWVLLYAFIYLPWFMYLEKHVTRHYYIIHSPIDNYIPFIEYFIVPYLFWFIFIIVGASYFFFTDKNGFYKLSAFFITGMTIFLIICTVFPNGVALRPYVFERNNIFTEMVRRIYMADTPTNVLPSIHVFNSIGISVAVANSAKLKERPWIQYTTHFISFLIILSTVFLKQHSVTDVIAAFVMAGIIYPFVYAPVKKNAPDVSRAPAHS